VLASIWRLSRLGKRQVRDELTAFFIFLTDSSCFVGSLCDSVKGLRIILDVFNKACSKHELIPASRCGGCWVRPDRGTTPCTAVLPATVGRCRGSLAGIRGAVRQFHLRTDRWLPVQLLAGNWFSWMVVKSNEKLANDNEVEGLRNVSGS